MGGWGKMHQEENYQDFLKWGGVFLGHSFVIIKWTCGGFFPKICSLTPIPYNYAQKSSENKVKKCK